MKKYIIKGGNELAGEITVSGTKNVVLKALIAACLTRDEVEIKNVPLISDFFAMLDLVKEIGGKVTLLDHSVKIKVEEIKTIKLPLEIGAKIRTSSMFLSPLLARSKEALIPNPGGCRIGARPIDRHIEGLEKMGAKISYMSQDGYFHAKTEGLKGTEYTFVKNTHTGTETLILAAVLAQGTTILRNAAQEPEVDDLIKLLNLMGAKIKRDARTITIEGVGKLHGASYTIMPDRNELVTFAIASALTGGKILIKNYDLETISAFLKPFEEAGGSYEVVESKIRFFMLNGTKPTTITTKPHPGFMTDWQGPWAIFMTQAEGVSQIDETVYENRFSYVRELAKMGAKMKQFDLKPQNPYEYYNFNYEEGREHKQGLRILGKTPLHNAVLNIADLRAGATLVLASLIARGESVIYGVEHLERGYEYFDERLKKLGAEIRSEEEIS